MNVVVVREYARLTTTKVDVTLDQATITASAFDWLCQLAARYEKSGAVLLQVESGRWLKLDNFVGVVETPCGMVLEILPKHLDSNDASATVSARQLLKKMLAEALELPARVTGHTSVESFDVPLLEWIMKEYVLSLDHLIKRGVRFDYSRVEEEQNYLRGQLDVVRQMRQGPCRAHVFNLRHDVFLPDRPENRLLKSALMRVCVTTQQADTWRIANELTGRLADIPPSRDISTDFRQWGSDRSMAHYALLRPWCELVLGQLMPLAIRGRTQGMSLLFPMEKLFETFVGKRLQRQIPAGVSLKRQASGQSLCRHEAKPIFELRPDFLLSRDGTPTAVMDTKWKRISAYDRAGKYGLKQADFYQLFSYGHKYLDGRGEMILVYPKTTNFCEILPVFEFSPQLTLWVAPFDLEQERMYWPAGWLDFHPEVAHAADYQS